jgi:hypothetical protein
MGRVVRGASFDGASGTGTRMYAVRRTVYVVCRLYVLYTISRRPYECTLYFVLRLHVLYTERTAYVTRHTSYAVVTYAGHNALVRTHVHRTDVCCTYRSTYPAST